MEAVDRQTYIIYLMEEELVSLLTLKLHLMEELEVANQMKEVDEDAIKLAEKYKELHEIKVKETMYRTMIIELKNIK